LKYSFLTHVAVAAMLAIISTAGNMKAAGPDTGNAAAYCEQSGGKVIDRAPMYGTNGSPSSWLRLTGTRQFCQFTSKQDGSRIHVLLETLYAVTPTLAALAYYAKPPANPPGPGNPASYYCTQLGGSDLFGGVNAAGGGWYGRGSQDSVLEACIFPDMSSIDSWGLTYNSASIIRGIDLTTVLRYTPPPAGH
jgi:putative hemolysin